MSSFLWASNTLKVIALSPGYFYTFQDPDRTNDNSYKQERVKEHCDS